MFLDQSLNTNLQIAVSILTWEYFNFLYIAYQMQSYIHISKFVFMQQNRYASLYKSPFDYRDAINNFIYLNFVPSIKIA